MDGYEESIFLNFNLSDCKMYTNSIGGHSFFIQLYEEFLLKPSSVHEKEFYLKMQNVKEKQKYFPRFFGVIKKNSPQFIIISSFIKQCTSFFKSYIINNNYTSSDIDFKHENLFQKLYNNLISSESENWEDYSSNKYFNFLKTELDAMNEKKRRWILFSFVNWRRDFLLNELIILENLTAGMLEPYIVDIKLGSTIKLSKRSNKIKKFYGASMEIGCRLMGMQRDEVFDMRYDTRNLKMEQFKEKIYLFFSNNEKLRNKVIHLLRSFRNDINNDNNHNKTGASLLIAYNPNEELKVKFIDFGTIEMNNNNILIDYVTAISNLIYLLENKDI